MATSRAAVAPTCDRAPSAMASEYRADGCGAAPGVASATTPNRSNEKGRPNRKRTRVAPQGPASPTSPLLRARCAPPAAGRRDVDVEIQSIPAVANRQRTARSTRPRRGRTQDVRTRRDRAGVVLFLARGEVVERVDVGLGRGGQGVGVGGLAGGDAATFLEADADLRLGVGAFGDRVHLEEPQDRLVRGDLVDGVEHRVDRAVAGGVGRLLLTIDGDGQEGLLRPLGAGDDPQGLHLDAIRARG